MSIRATARSTSSPIRAVRAPAANRRPPARAGRRPRPHCAAAAHPQGTAARRARLRRPAPLHPAPQPLEPAAPRHRLRPRPEGADRQTRRRALRPPPLARLAQAQVRGRPGVRRRRLHRGRRQQRGLRRPAARPLPGRAPAQRVRPAAVAPYAVRARPGAPVAAPLTRPEVEDPGIGARSFTIDSLVDRLDHGPWHGALRHGRAVTAAARRTPHAASTCSAKVRTEVRR
ncbi:hypothetical protein ACIHEI_16305 [Kitasatospora sp. NPDC051984]|uniref:non-homologous end-joining DNA ligase LigD n=1 Tax=Kitasatospora sp. NPDC051984 TaxID=3364059 RepID=UPI0037C71EE7